MPLKVNLSPRLAAILQALFVAFLWSTSWVLIKIGLADIPPLTFAGLRYAIAAGVLMPFFLRGGGISSARTLKKHEWLLLAVLGVLFYPLAQGAQYISLDHLPAVTTNLLLGLSPVVIALLAAVLIREAPSWIQWLGVIVALLGSFVYFYPPQFPADAMIGVVAALVGIGANSLSTIISRKLNRQQNLSALTVTAISMGIGGPLLLVAGIVTQGLPAINITGWLIILWLALVNTAFAFTLYNHTLRILTAAESSVMTNTMMIQVPILAVIFLGESLSVQQVIGLVIVATGTFIVQVKSTKKTGG
jgi:drug/metabolite transporter (DMT)-like permease